MSAPETGSFEQIATVEATRERSGRILIEIVALPATEWAGVRVPVCALPPQVEATVTVNLGDLSPVTRAAAEATA